MNTIVLLRSQQILWSIELFVGTRAEPPQMRAEGGLGGFTVWFHRDDRIPAAPALQRLSLSPLMLFPPRLVAGVGVGGALQKCLLYQVD